MKEEMKQILDMLAAGKISAEDAERLIDKLGDDDTKRSTGSSRPKYLRVHVDGADGDKVDVRIPLALIKTGIKFTAVMPDHVTEKLGEKGVDLSRLSELEGDELYDALQDLQVDVDSGEGTVRVYCE